MEDFDEIETKIVDDLEVETGKNLEKKKSSVSKLDDEIEAQNKARKLSEINQKVQKENKDNVKNFAKSQKPKKSLKKRIIAWALGVGIFAGAVAGGFAIKNKIEDNTTGDGAYQKAIQSRYEKVDATLTKRLNNDTYTSISNKSVKTIKFEEPELNDVELVINFEGDESVINKKMQAKAIYKVLINYYNKLVDAEESNNMLDYLDCLNEIFENMTFQSKESYKKVQSIKFDGCNENASEKINNLLGLEKKYDGIVKQVAFLPYNIEVVEWIPNPETEILNYTFKLSGISYCETVGENSDKIQNSDNLISDKTYNKSKIKAYYRDIEISSTTTYNDYVGEDKQLQNNIKRFVNGELSEDYFAIKTTYFGEANMENIFDEFMNMKNGNFDYEKPENVDMSLYK